MAHMRVIWHCEIFDTTPDEWWHLHHKFNTGIQPQQERCQVRYPYTVMKVPCLMPWFNEQLLHAFLVQHCTIILQRVACKNCMQHLCMKPPHYQPLDARRGVSSGIGQRYFHVSVKLVAVAGQVPDQVIHYAIALVVDNHRSRHPCSTRSMILYFWVFTVYKIILA